MENTPKLAEMPLRSLQHQTGLRGSLEAMLRAARELPAAELPALIGEIEAVKATAWARLTEAPAPVTHDELLGIRVASERLGVSKDYLYRHHRELPFTRRQGKKLLFSALGIDKHIRQNRP